MVIDGLFIRNFRGIKQLEISDFGKVNLLTGKNNCGKTSVLEALFLVVGISNPSLSLNINNFRGIALSNDQEFSFNFYKLDFTNQITISAEQTGNKKRVLHLDPILTSTPGFIKEDLDNKNESFDTNISKTSLANIEGLRLDYTLYKNDKEDHSYISDISLKRGQRIIPKDYIEEINATFQSPAIGDSGIVVQLEKIIIDKKLDELIPVLKKIDSSISDLRIGTNGIIYVDTGFERLIPLNIMGDGIRRLVALITSIYSMKNGILLIDEIDTGFHYSTLKMLWKTILDASSRYNVQIFATTHSYECIQAFSEAHKEYLNFEDLRLFRIEKSAKGDHKSYKYSTEVLNAAMESEWEIR